MAIDRTKFKPTPLSVIDQTKKEAESRMVSMGSARRFTSYAIVEEGVNEFRILPTMDGSSPYVPFCYSMLEVMSDTYDENGNKTGQELKFKRVFLATTHSDQMNGKDPIALYLNFVKAKAEALYASDKEKKKKFLEPLFGGKVNGKFIWGPTPNNRYVCYVVPRGGDAPVKLELNNTWFKDIQRISVNETGDDGIVLDIFSSPEDGVPLIIEKYKDADKFKFNLRTKGLPKGKSWDEFYKDNMVPDSMLEKLASLDSLKDLFVDVYSKRDYDLAVEGLRRFDKKHIEYSIFDDKEFLIELEVISKLVPERVSSEGSVEEEKSEDKPKGEEPKKASVAKMKLFLSEYIEETYPGKELPDLSKEEVAIWYELAMEDEELPFKNDPVEVDDSEEDIEEEQQEQPKRPKKVEAPQKEEVSSDIPMSVAEKLKKLREARNKTV